MQGSSPSRIKSPGQGGTGCTVPDRENAQKPGTSPPEVEKMLKTFVFTSQHWGNNFIVFV